MLELGIIITLLKWVMFLVLIIFVGLIALIIIGLILSPKITEEEVYNAVSFPNWKTGFQIWNELRELKNVQRPTFFDVTPPYIYLSKLIDDGFIEYREKEISKEKWHARGRLPQLEYRRTGKKREKKQPHLDAILEPTKS